MIRLFANFAYLRKKKKLWGGSHLAKKIFMDSLETSEDIIHSYVGYLDKVAVRARREPLPRRRRVFIDYLISKYDVLINTFLYILNSSCR